MSAHTPGPWEFFRVGRTTDYSVIWAPNATASKRRIATISNTGKGIDEFLANARLIAAAPALLKKLEQAVVELDEVVLLLRDRGLPGTAQIMSEAAENKRILIAKIEGETP